jgi:uncharacterized protein YjbI with pentapeptide repeats
MTKIMEKTRLKIHSGLQNIKKSIVNPLVRMAGKFLSSPLCRGFLIIIPFAGLLLFLDYHVFLSVKEVNWIDVIARTHGIFFDIVLLGLFLLIVEIIRGKKRKIERYREELEDIFFWNEKQGIYKKAGLLRRLSAAGAKIKQLPGIVLTFGEINNVNLEDTHLEGADLRGARLNNALLNRAVLTTYAVTTQKEMVLSTEHHDTRIRGAELNNAQLCDVEGACLDFTGSHMMYAKMNRANLRAAIFHKTILRFAEINEASCADADFSEADLYRATFKGADLQGTMFSRNKKNKWENGYCAQLIHTDFENAQLNGTMMNHVDMSHANCKNASFMNAKLRSTHLGWVSFENALLIDADLHDADMNNTILKGAHLAGANLRNAKNLTLEQLKEAKTLYQASLDDHLLKEITKSGYNHLFQWPEDQEA